MISYRELMKLALPEMDVDGIKVEHVTVGGDAARAERLYGMFHGGRYVPEGTYTRVFVDGRMWMSDTPDEMRDHSEVFYQMLRRGGRVLINGLGAGMIVKAALALENVEHVDVVEREQRVIDNIGPHYACDRLTIHHGDAYQMKWPTGTRWTVAWHDIWLDISGDNYEGMKRLHRMYGRRVDWQESWCRYQVKRLAKPDPYWY